VYRNHCTKWGKKKGRHPEDGLFSVNELGGEKVKEKLHERGAMSRNVTETVYRGGDGDKEKKRTIMA